jgi:hypothetical protein
LQRLKHLPVPPKGRWSGNQFAQIVHRQMCTMAPKLIAIPLRATPITRPKFPLDPTSTPESASSMTTARAGSTPSSFAAIK